MSATSATAVPGGVDSPAGKLVYLALAGADESAVAELRRRLDMKRVEVYAILGTLESRGLVEQVSADTYRAVA